MNHCIFYQYSYFLISGSLGLGACATNKLKEGAIDKLPPSLPNIILIMADDLGYSDIGCYGSEIQTPNIDRLASEGVRFTQFYNASVCCPTRASLMSGLYPHQAGVGNMDADWGYESYQGRIKHSVNTLAETLSGAGYSTIMAGKWHLGTREGDNPWERGFDDFYGIPKGGGVYFWPPQLDRDIVLYDNTNGLGPVITQPDSTTFYSTDVFTDYLVGKITSHKNKDAPFFIYAAYIAPHWPQQAKEEDIQKYIGKYKEGWHVLRKARYQRQINLGIIDTSFMISPDDGVDWNNLSQNQIDKFDRQMAVYAAQIDNLDQNIGKILTSLDQNNLAENTMVIFLSDNGAQKNGEEGFERNPGTVFGSKESLSGYARGWGNLSNTPFRKYKLEQYNGGTSTPFIVRWPSLLKNKNEVSRQVAHVIDIYPTCTASAGISLNDFTVNKLQKLEGINLIPHFKNTQFEIDRELFWEHNGNWAIRKGDWKLVTTYNEEPELFNLADDPAEQKDLSSEFIQKFNELKLDYINWAGKTGVLPWPVERLN
jgi:arylsulfatase A-like enzyme